MTGTLRTISCLSLLSLLVPTPVASMPPGQRPAFKLFPTSHGPRRAARVADLSRLGFSFFRGKKLADLVTGSTMRVFHPGGTFDTEEFGKDGIARYEMDGEFPGQMEERYWFKEDRYCMASLRTAHCFHIVRDRSGIIYRIRAAEEYQLLERIAISRGT